MVEEYNRSHERSKEEFKGHHFVECDCGSQIHYIDTVDMTTVKSECFILIWYDPETKQLQAAHHMGFTMEGLGRLAGLMDRVMMGSIIDLTGGK